MESYENLKTELLKIGNDIESLLDRAETIPGIAKNHFSGWKKTCKAVQDQLKNEMLRTAIVGTIKSGKSTLVNSILKGDYLKRGAGVVTSIVTRIQKGSTLNAVLYFKSWDNINSEIQRALILFPGFESNEPFDIRRKKDRSLLDKTLNNLSSEVIIKDGMRDVNIVLLESYLKGYHRVKDIISSENITAQYKNERFEIHKEFVSNDSLSVYLKDIRLKIDSMKDYGIEIADCQGSDSPNPIHLSMIQDYLIKTNLILYVISSRTGVREADIKFLSIIKKMGSMENILFVVNIDFSEHESKEDLDRVVRKITEDISLIQPKPILFNFSGLYNLLKIFEKSLSSKEKKRIEHWENDKEFISFSNSETKRFYKILDHKFKTEQTSLFLNNNLARLSLVCSGIKSWISLTCQLFSEDAKGVVQIIEKLNSRQQRIRQVESMAGPALEGAVLKTKKELKEEIEKFFSDRAGTLIGMTVDFIKNYNIDYEKYEDIGNGSGLTGILYSLFQEISQGLDRYIAETVNPKIVRFAADIEDRILTKFHNIGEPFVLMINDSMAEYNIDFEDKEIDPIDIQAIKRIASLNLPSVSTSIHYSAKIRTEALIRLFFYSALRIFKKAFKKENSSDTEEKRVVLKHGVRRMKLEIERSLMFHFKSYKENIKFQYILKLIDAVSETLKDILGDRFQAYSTDFALLADNTNREKEQKDYIIKLLKDIDAESERLRASISNLKKKFDLSG